MSRLGDIAERVMIGMERKAAKTDLADIKDLLEEMHEKQAEVAKKQEEFRQETNKLWGEATKDVHERVEALCQEIQKELVSHFKSNGMGIRKSGTGSGTAYVAIGSDDNKNPDIAGRYQSEVWININMTFEGEEKATALFKNEEGVMSFDLKDKGTVAALMQEVEKADKKGFWKLDEEPGPTIHWRR